MADDLGPLRSLPARSTRNDSWFASPAFRLWSLGACALLAVVGWAYWPALIDICSAWTSNPDYTHGFFVIPISVWLLWLRREQAPQAISIDWRGLGLIILAGAIRCLAGRFFLL